MKQRTKREYSEKEYWEGKVPDDKFDEYLNKYLSRTKMQLDSDWEFYIIFSLFKVAGICQGILGRVRDGTAASEFALQMGKRAIEYANLGWEKAKNIS